MKFTIEFEQEEDGRWIAGVLELPGVLAYGRTQVEAITKAQALGLRVLTNPLEPSAPSDEPIRAVPVCLEGWYQQGSVVFAETPTQIREHTRVLVTFLESDNVDLSAYGIEPTQAVELRARLATFAEDWDSPAMSVYDSYDAAKGAR